MAPRSILLTDGESPLRDVLVRAHSSEGHEVQVSDTSKAEDRSSEFGPDRKFAARFETCESRSVKNAGLKGYE